MNALTQACQHQYVNVKITNIRPIGSVRNGHVCDKLSLNEAIQRPCPGDSAMASVFRSFPLAIRKKSSNWSTRTQNSENPVNFIQLCYLFQAYRLLYRDCVDHFAFDVQFFDSCRTQWVLKNTSCGA